jgi:hypothetical protein
MRSDRAPLLALLLVLLLAAWLRAPQVTAGLPFIYLEDEAHHFQRTVEMVKRGTYDPGYFNKPSLHFYLRMPVVAASFLSAARAGEVKRLQEVVTRSPRGGWSYTASHPRLLAWNRAFGVLLGLLVVALTFALARDLTGSGTLAAGAALLAAASPALSIDAAKVGVDTPLVLMCLLAIWLALRLQARFSYGGLVAAGLVAGLAVSTKYNAAPIALVPLLACVAAGRRDAGAILLALALPVAGFVLGTPYALIDLPSFLDDVAYEGWHYGTAGHAWATGQPGLSQAWFYLRWFASSEAIGGLAVVLGAAGVANLLLRRDRGALTFLAFPVLFFALMAGQKVNFTRNVLVLLPILAVLAAVAVQALASRVGRTWIAAGVLAVAAVQPGIAAAVARRPPPTDSRVLAAEWLGRASAGRSENAVASELNWPFAGPGTARVTTVDTRRLDPVALFMDGFDRLVTDTSFAAGSARSMLREEHVQPGEKAGARVVISPEVRIYRLEEPAEADLARALWPREAALTPTVRYGSGDALRARQADRCTGVAGEPDVPPDGDCWIRKRAMRVALDQAALLPLARGAPRPLRIEMQLHSPWPGQRCVIRAGEWTSADLCAGQSASTWFTASASAPSDAVLSEGGFILRTAEVHPLPGGRRGRAGLALRDVKVNR